MRVARDERTNWKRNPVTKLRLEKPFVDIRTKGFTITSGQWGRLKYSHYKLLDIKVWKNLFLPDNQDKLGLQHQVSLDIPLQNQFYHRPELHTLYRPRGRAFEMRNLPTHCNHVSHNISLVWERAVQNIYHQSQHLACLRKGIIRQFIILQ